ncbi:MAG: hypothetical protein K6U89_14070 [Chloroflexi bacterium]|nr:hypothetical protein [Chloroflexota bacterium]
MTPWYATQPFGAEVHEYFRLLRQVTTRLQDEHHAYRFMLTIKLDPASARELEDRMADALRAPDWPESPEEAAAIIAEVANYVLERAVQEAQPRTDDERGFLCLSILLDLERALLSAATGATADKRRAVATSFHTLVQDLVPWRLVNKHFWTEALRRLHWAAVSTLLRLFDWLRGTYAAVGAENALTVAACIRGLIEAAGDSFLALNGAPRLLAQEFSRVKRAVLGELDWEGFGSSQLEEQLLDFVYASRQAIADRKPRSARQYIDALGISGAYQLYGELSELMHPAMASVVGCYGTHTVRDSYEEFIVWPSKRMEFVQDMCEKSKQIVSDALQASGNIALMVLGVLNYLPLEELHTKALEGWDLSGIAAWPEVAKLIEGAT